jgi:hypothetical protein
MLPIQILLVSLILFELFKVLVRCLMMYHPMMAALFFISLFLPPPTPPSSQCLPPIVQHPQRCLTSTRRIPTRRTLATTVAFLLPTAGISLPLFLLLTMWFPVGLLALLHPWLAANHLHLMALILHFILKNCFLFFERSSASISDACRLQTAQSPTLGFAALATRGAGCIWP